VDLREVAEDARELMAPLLRQRALELQVALEGCGPEAIVRGDSQRLSQVFVNLLANAAKFAPEASTIRLGGRRSGGEVEVWIEDEGRGVPVGSTDAIFERFQRGSDSEPDAPGLGLGLWIVKSIIDRHGGTVRVERTAEQRTRFTVTLPLERQDEPQAEET
jgi:signal transduction histidine kinase